MSTKTWSFVDANDVYTGKTFTGPAHALAANTPPACRSVEGHLERDPNRQDPELERSRTLERIEALEIKQLRPLRELAIDPDDAEAKQRLAEIERLISGHRATIQAIAETDTSADARETPR
jgi:hypothetical protein